MSDDVDQTGDERTPLPEPHMSRRRLLETGGALAAGASMSGLIGAGTAGAATGGSAATSEFVPFSIGIKGTGETLQSALVAAANRASPAGKSAILSEALTSMVVANGPNYQKIPFNLSFTLHFRGAA